MKVVVDISAEETLKKIEAAITGKRPVVIIPWYLKNEFIGKINGNKFEIQKTRSSGFLFNYKYARVFYGTVTETPDGKAEINGEFKMNDIVKGLIIGFYIAAVIGIICNIFMGESVIETIICFVVFALANILLIKLLSLAFRKDEAAVIEFLEGLK